MNKKKIIIIGAGTAGIVIANRLKSYFDVTLIEKSKNKNYPIFYKIPLLIGILFRKNNNKYIIKKEFTLRNNRKIPFHESNILGGASVMNGAVHVFGFRSKWKQILDQFQFSFEDLDESYNFLYSEQLKQKNKITIRKSYLNRIDYAFFSSLEKMNIKEVDMNISESVGYGPIYNTIRKYFRTTVLDILKNKKFELNLNERVIDLFLQDNKLLGVKTEKRILKSDYIILSAGVIGSNNLMLNFQNNLNEKHPFKKQKIGNSIKDHTNIRINVLANQNIGSLNEIHKSVTKRLFLGIKHLFGIPTVLRGTGATSAAYLDLDKDGEIDTRIQILQFSEFGRHGSSGSLFSNSNPSFSISINAIHPESTGLIDVKDNDLVISPNYLSSKKDIEILKLALDFCLKLLSLKPISQYISKIYDFEIIQNYPEKYIHDTMYSGHHLIGGLQEIIDEDMRCEGFNNLFICDASIMDKFVASNIHSTVVLLADMFSKKFIEKYK